MNITIDYLCNRPEFILDVANHIWDHWGDDYIELTNIKTINDMIDYYSNTQTDKLPIAYVLFNDNNLIATLVIDTEDMGVHPELTPWMVSIYTIPEYRGRGYASLLIEHAIKDRPLLYLWTYNDRYANLYKRFGFIYLETIETHGQYKNIIVMSRKI